MSPFLTESERGTRSLVHYLVILKGALAFGMLLRRQLRLQPGLGVSPVPVGGGG